MKLFFLVLSFIIHVSLFGQYNDLEPFDVNEMKIKSVIEWTILTDSLKIDTLGGHLFLYDTLGRLIEKREFRRVSDAQYKSYTYLYNDKGRLIDVIYKNPRVIDWSFFPKINKPDSSLCYEYEFGKISKIIKRWRSGENKELQYYYGYFVNNSDGTNRFLSQSSFSKEFIYNAPSVDKQHNDDEMEINMSLLEKIETSSDGNLQELIVFVYTFY